MKLRRAFVGMSLSWMMCSALVHAGVGGGVYFWFVKRQPPPIVAELDLSMMPMVPMIPNAGGGRGAQQPEKWVLPKKRKEAPIPQAAEKVESKQEVVQQETQTTACEGNCSEGPLVGHGWGGGSGQGEGAYVPAEATSRKPRWIQNFLTSRDYPQIARQEGKDGRVVLTVFINASGIVQDVRLLQGSYPALNEVALSKVKQAVFTPAYDARGQAVSCKVTLPIRFELR